MTARSENELFARNLRRLCAERRSVSEICRQIGVNRQQFARYLNGAARPSPHNLRRICRYFGVSAEALASERGLIRLDNAAPDLRGARGAEILTTVFPGEARALRRLTGLYHAHYRSPSQPDRVIRALVEVVERDGAFQSRTLERTRHPETGLVSRARYVGLVASHGDTLFLVERGRNAGRDVSETILTPAHRASRLWLTGVLLAFSWLSGKPYASRCVWKKLRPSVGIREAVAACGAYPLDDRRIDDLVVEHLSMAAEDGLEPLARMARR